MRKFVLIIFLILNLPRAQDIAGQYTLSALYTTYYNIAREDTDIEFTDTHDLGINLFSQTILQGEIFRKDYKGPYPEIILNSQEVILNVNFNEDGSAAITDGSSYPTVDVVDCQALETILPITDNFMYTSDLQADNYIPFKNMIGLAPEEGWLPWPLPYRGYSAGSISLITTGYFDLIPSEPTQTSIPFPIHFGDFNGNGVIDYDLGEGIPANELLPGFSLGSVFKCSMPSFIPGNGNADMYMEWHAIDGQLSESGLGDIIGEDEDDDGTDFDGIFTLQEMKTTKLSTNCGYNYSVAGDQVDFFQEIGMENCLECSNNDCYRFQYLMYIVDPGLQSWGYFLTYNAYNGIQVDDSDHDFNGTDGRLIMEVVPTCIKNIMVRQFMIEFRQDGESEEIPIAGCIDDAACNYHPCANIDDGSCYYISEDGCDCNEYAIYYFDGDSDGIGNPAERHTKCPANVTCYSEGELLESWCLEHSDSDDTIWCPSNVIDCDGQCDGSAAVDECGTCNGNGCYNQDCENYPLSSYDCTGVSLSVLVSSTIPEEYNIQNIYPNPFNPIANVTYGLPEYTNVEIVVFDLNGIQVQTLISGFQSPGFYSVNWNAGNNASGVYFVKMIARSSEGGVTEEYINTQKLMLIK